MAFALVGSVTQAYSSGATSVAVDKPTGVQQGDIMFALLCRYNVGAVTSVPSGWTIVTYLTQSSTVRWSLYYKVAGNSEPANYTWGWANSAKTLVQTAAYRDIFDAADPIDAYSNTNYATNDTICRGGSVTVSVNGSPLLLFCCVYNTSATTFTGPSGFTEDGDSGHTDPDFYGAFYSKTANAGATGNQDATMSQSLAFKHAFLVALNPHVGSRSPADAGAQGLVLAVETSGGSSSVTVATFSADAGAEGLGYTVGAGRTVATSPAEAAAEALILGVDTTKIIDVLVADAGAEGTQIAISAGCSLGLLPAQAGAEGLILDAAVVVAVDALPADAGAQGLATEVQAGVNVSVLPAAAVAHGLVLTVRAGTAGLRRTYPAMVRTYPPLCRAA